MVGPVVVIIAGILTAWLAIKSNDGLVEDDYYKEGLAVNQRLKRDHKAGDLGLHADVTVAGLDLRIRITANDTNPFPPILTARFIHLTRSGQGSDRHPASRRAGSTAANWRQRFQGAGSSPSRNRPVLGGSREWRSGAGKDSGWGRRKGIYDQSICHWEVTYGLGTIVSSASGLMSLGVIVGVLVIGVVRGQDVRQKIEEDGKNAGK